MKRIAAVLCAVAAFAIVLSGCNLNLFSAFDKVKVLSSSELLALATTNPDDLVSKVQDYVDSGSITEANAPDIVPSLEKVYTTQPTTTTGQKAAVLAGEIIINSDPETSSVVHGVIGAVSDALSSGGTIDPDTFIGDIFPPNLDLAGLQNILDNLDNAASAYADLAPTLAGNDPGLTNGETGDMAQLAVVALVVASIRDDINNDTAILTAIQNGTPLSVSNNPFDPTGGSTYDGELGDILTFAGLDLGI